MATHAPLDIGFDLLTTGVPSSAWLAFSFPLGGVRFAVLTLRSPLQHLSVVLDSAHLLTEALGAALLAWVWRHTVRREVPPPTRGMTRGNAAPSSAWPNPRRVVRGA
jgi:hypothetical protein